MKHTFLFEPGVWSATGTFWSAEGREIEAEGRTEISHSKECWMLAGRMRVLASPPVEFLSVYCIEPPQRDLRTYRWTSENSTLGKLHGVFTITGSSILSLYRSEQGAYQGTEHLTRLDDDHYEACGLLLMEDRRLSSWHLALRR